MSEHAARAALERMNLREVALAPHYQSFAADMRQMAMTVPEEANAAFLERRAELCAAYGFSTNEQRKPFGFSNGIAIIPVSGTLINRFGACWGFVTGYNFIRSQLNAALVDDDVKGIVFDLNSYGGEVAGCFELADDIYAARAQKPILGVIDSNCYSACYAIGSACSKLVSTPSGGSGSIGVVAMHVDASKMYDDWGIKVTYIFSGDHKVDGNPYEPLPKDVKANIKKGVDKTRGVFVEAVARYRNMDAQAVHDTQAAIYRAEEALDLGLIDAIETPVAAVQAFFTELSGSLSEEDETMSTQTNEPGATQVTPEQIAQATAAGTAAGVSQGRTDERARISAIMSCDEAADRADFAKHLALNTDMSVDVAKGVLAAAPKEQQQAPAAAATNRFQAAMNSDVHPEVGADGGAGAEGGDGEESMAKQILHAQASATGQAKH